MTKVEGGGSLGGKLKQTILQPITGGVKFTEEEMLNKDLSDAYSDMPGADNYDINNPLLDNMAIAQEKYTRMATVNAGLEIDLMKDLTFRTAASYMWQQIREDYWDDGSTRQADANQSPYGYGYRNNGEKFSWQVTNTLNYSFNLDDNKHNFSVLLGQETYYQEKMNLDNEYRKFPSGNFELNDVAMGTPYEWKSERIRKVWFLFLVVCHIILRNVIYLQVHYVLMVRPSLQEETNGVFFPLLQLHGVFQKRNS